MRPNSGLVRDTQCVHYAERRVSMHGTRMEMHGCCFWDPALLIVGICFRQTCGYCAFRMCSIEFIAPIRMDGNVIGNSSIVVGLCYKERVIFILLPFFSLFLHMVDSGYLLHGIRNPLVDSYRNEWILEGY
ncbi:hypothetical protein NE237_001926 [Protea cynaroides]|uniref:Uncharacterized protein n=1 Tax=Protea cynaroides TaxID=273540 RepID=A0A9Q0KU82_9MAGN|nr:hypothetical protein NE237_001926 [Protea cynaroides]